MSAATDGLRTALHITAQRPVRKQDRNYRAGAERGKGRRRLPDLAPTGLAPAALRARIPGFPAPGTAECADLG